MGDGRSFQGCKASSEKCYKPSEIIKCGISLIQPEIADVGYCFSADDGNNYIDDVSDIRYCSCICSEDGCIEKACKRVMQVPAQTTGSFHIIVQPFMIIMTTPNMLLLHSSVQKLPRAR